MKKSSASRVLNKAKDRRREHLNYDHSKEGNK